MKHTGPSNPNTSALIRVLKGSDAPIWKKIAEEVASPKRNRTVINIDQLQSLVNDNEIVCIPGKVLGMGVIQKKITIAALSFSESAKAKISAAGGKIVSISQLFDSHPKGTNVRILKGVQTR